MTEKGNEGMNAEIGSDLEMRSIAGGLDILA
jgi:hypothetical protein